jgi:hypothetical protein
MYPLAQKHTSTQSQTRTENAWQVASDIHFVIDKCPYVFCDNSVYNLLKLLNPIWCLQTLRSKLMRSWIIPPPERINTIKWYISNTTGKDSHQKCCDSSIMNVKPCIEVHEFVGIHHVGRCSCVYYSINAWNDSLYTVQTTLKILGRATTFHRTDLATACSQYSGHVNVMTLYLNDRWCTWQSQVTCHLCCPWLVCERLQKHPFYWQPSVDRSTFGYGTYIL